MNIVVTGGRGFIGANLCNKLIENGHQVYIVDNMMCPSPLSVVGAVHFDYDVQNFVRGGYLNNTKIDIVYHLASIASPKWYKEHPLATIKTNVNGTMAMCEFAKQHGAHLIFTSTSEVYGDPEVHPQTEDYNGNVDPLSTRACYDESKRCAETIIQEYVRLGLDATILRLFNTYGPGMRVDDGRAVSEFICRALQGHQLQIHNTGEQTRSFCYIYDMVEWLVFAMDAPDLGPYNVGNPDEHSIIELVYTIGRVMMQQLEGRITYLENHDSADPKIRKPDIRKAQATFGNPLHRKGLFISFEAGLVQTVQYFREILDGSTSAT
jgi:UDP-glucuronate decarboxylase